MYPIYSFKWLKKSDGDENPVQIRSAAESWIWKNDRATVHTVRAIKYHLFHSCISPAKCEDWTSISGNHTFLGPVNFFHDGSHSLTAALSFHCSHFHQLQKLQQLCGFLSPLRTEELNF
jgi:hypothetical protein